MIEWDDNRSLLCELTNPEALIKFEQIMFVLEVRVRLIAIGNAFAERIRTFARIE